MRHHKILKVGTDRWAVLRWAVLRWAVRLRSLWLLASLALWVFLSGCAHTPPPDHITITLDLPQVEYSEE